MSGTPDLSKVVPVSSMQGDSAEDTELLQSMLQEARDYVSGHAWCNDIKSEYFGFGVGGIAAVFLFEISPARSGVDNHVWAVVGDIPPLYITVDDAPNPACAMDAYIGAMEQWAAAAAAGDSMEGLPPVNAPANRENAEALKKRLKFLDAEFVEPRRADLS